MISKTMIPLCLFTALGLALCGCGEIGGTGKTVDDFRNAIPDLKKNEPTTSTNEQGNTVYNWDFNGRLVSMPVSKKGKVLQVNITVRFHDKLGAITDLAVMTAILNVISGDKVDAKEVVGWVVDNNTKEGAKKTFAPKGGKVFIVEVNKIVRTSKEHIVLLWLIQ